MRTILIGDVHLADKAPKNCTDSYLDDLFDLLYQVHDVASTYDAVAVIQAGDLFHVKTPSKNSHSMVLRTIEWARSCPVPVFVVPGNHDYDNGDRPASVLSTQPLGVVVSSGAIRLLEGWGPEDLEIPVFGLPWLHSWSDNSVCSALQSYRDLQDIEEISNALVVAHAPIYKPGSEPPHEFYPAGKMAEYMNMTGSFYHGHIHEPSGIWRHNGVTFCNHGALSRGSLTSESVDREIAVTVWDSDTVTFERVLLNAKPASEVFKLTQALDLKERNKDFRSFISMLDSSVVEVTSDEDIIRDIRSRADVSDNVIRLAESLIREVS